MGWPLPTWVQKEIDVYPCIPGEVGRAFRGICLTQAVVLDAGGNASMCKCEPQWLWDTQLEAMSCGPVSYSSLCGVRGLPSRNVELPEPKAFIGL